ncbi:DNA cytosine methyltransferase [Streptomyces iranensis]|uniref:DNA (cytosine-5-)-methyltransferase n=1 Tax=Streptomyces iranensis TaxID=576784 RepID=A0A060ZY05_9ACTN|nr:DNA cytosine methyltransferase [Streptomyces iranensis]MBP2068407.1 site-specific DNA-cytosine methylase [Streptomyces iranensis]CDR08039.1 DNA-cytosine methyltransferase [Streptomyces iranensis]
MSFLYPRLLAEQARPLFVEYQHLTAAELTRQVAVAHESAVYVATGGDRVSAAQLHELRAGVVELAQRAGFPDKSDRASNADFDLRLAALLHAEMGMVPAEAASRDVWVFLALVLLPDVAFWRYPRPPKDRILGTDLTRHVFGRLWWRAQLVRSPDDPDPYAALEILGEAAFDQIYARRAALGGSPHMVRAILRVWKNLDLTGLNERETLRDFLKRLLRLAPFVLFDGIETDALDHELRAVAQESVDAQRVSASIRRTESTQTGQDGPVDSINGEERLPTLPEEESPIPRRASVVPADSRRFTSVEICAGAGAQALGLENAGFDPVLLIDSKADACFTIDLNRSEWDVVCMDVVQFHPRMRPETLGVDLVSGGLPRVKSSATVGRAEDSEERRVLRAAVDLVRDIRPKALLLENVPDLVEVPQFDAERSWIEAQLRSAGYRSSWRVLNAADFGVPQNRSSGFLVALQDPYFFRFSWPEPSELPPPTVGQVLGPSMSAHGWPGAARWVKGADRIAPALVGGSDRRGGADLGPTGSKKAWAALGVNGTSLGNEVPDADFPVDGQPKLTIDQAASIQAFPPDWRFFGGKTSRYRQIGHAMPPPLATAVGSAIAAALRS